ncbi:long-chain acyl-CoA synthetase [hydrothermal vent metagenome]|uniref:Long-chain acyl-CoA synthetase n=1 Tax=hydrothermal vent metagenome TaxID=652676 RepID=A0A3B0Z3P7_9ZZZZ
MNFFQQLKEQTENDRLILYSAPIINRTLSGQVTLEEYIAFLTEAYHHVKHTVPLLMAAGSRIPGNMEWMRSALAEYIEEELGHEEWILNDLAACGADNELIRNSQPVLATELMISYAYDVINRINPLGFFGMVHVLEGTSIATADKAADAIQASLSLPDGAFTYLRSHGALDQEHVKFFASLMDRITDEEQQKYITHCTKVFYRLYGDIFRSINPTDQLQAA